MANWVIIYLVIMFIWCCVGFVVGYVVDDEFHYFGAFIGVITGFIWPLSIIGFILIGIGKLICRIVYKEK